MCDFVVETRISSENGRFLLVAPRAALCDAEKLVPVIFVGLLVAVAACDCRSRDKRVALRGSA